MYTMARLSGPLLRFAFTLCLTLAYPLPNMAQTVRKEVAREKFDIEAFNKNKAGSCWEETLIDGTLVRSFELSSSGYLQEMKPPNSPYIYKTAFDSHGKLNATTIEFYQARVGESLFYDAKGNIAREENHDKLFAYSVENLAKDMMANFDLDIMNPAHIKSFTRFIAEESSKNQPLYMFYAYAGAKPGTVDGYIIHGETGQLLLKLAFDADEPSSTVYDEYLHRFSK